jgi:hypothetical protein
VTDEELTCSAGAFTNTLADVLCKDTMCGDLSDKWTVEAGVVATCTEVQFELKIMIIVI